MRTTILLRKCLIINPLRFVVYFVLSISVTGLLPPSEIFSSTAYATGGNRGGAGGGQMSGGGNFQRGDLNRIRAREGAQDMDPERKRGRIHRNNSDHAGALTDRERAERRKRISNAENAEQRNQLREEYRRKAENRIVVV